MCEFTIESIAKSYAVKTEKAFLLKLTFSLGCKGLDVPYKRSCISEKNSFFETLIFVSGVHGFNEVISIRVECIQTVELTTKIQHLSLLIIKL